MQYANQISQDLELPNSDGYKKKSLNSWKLAPVVPKNKGLPGEMGKVRFSVFRTGSRPGDSEAGARHFGGRGRSGLTL